MIVVDASLVVKWFVWEAGSDIARALFMQNLGEMHGPPQLVVEVLATFVRRANDRQQTLERSQEDLSQFARTIGAGVVRISDGSFERARNAARIAFDLGHPLKDCLYLDLAMQLDCPLVTFDRRLADRAKSVWPKIEVPA